MKIIIVLNFVYFPLKKKTLNYIMCNNLLIRDKPKTVLSQLNFNWWSKESFQFVNTM